MNITSWLVQLNSQLVAPQGRRRRHPHSLAVSAIVETLEPRQMLSAAAVASAPVIANAGPSLTYTEGAPPALVASHATVTDSTGSFAGSTLTIATTNGGPGDQLGILNGNGVGVGPKGAVMFATSPTATPTQIGTVTGGQGNTPLVITFNPSATQATVQAVLDQVGYGNGLSTLAIPDRSISIQFTDGSGVASAAVTKSIHIIPAPVVGNILPTQAYQEGAPPVPVAANAKIGDAPSAYANSTIRVQITNPSAGDQLGIANGQGFGLGPKGAVLYSSSPTATPVVIGTIAAGTGPAALVVTFNSNSTHAGVQAVLDQVVYGNGLSTLPTADRHLSIVFTDGNKVASVSVIETIHVITGPVIGGLGNGPVNYAVNSHPVALAPNAVIADAANAYANSRLSVQLSGGNASDQLGIQANGALTLGPNGTLLFNNVVIGTFSGGSGASALVITFNAKATHDSVQAVLDNITFSYTTTSATPLLSNRLATFSFTDGNNVTSALQGQGIHVTN